MVEELEFERVKIRTRFGKIITLSIKGKNSEQLFGTDLFGVDVVVFRDDIESMYPIGNEGVNYDRK